MYDDGDYDRIAHRGEIGGGRGACQNSAKVNDGVLGKEQEAYFRERQS